MHMLVEVPCPLNVTISGRSCLNDLGVPYCKCCLNGFGFIAFVV